MQLQRPRRTLHLFAGAGGGIYADLLLGHRPCAAVELDAYCRDVLVARQWDGTLPWFPIYEDVRDFAGKPWRGCIDIIAGGFPCFTADTMVLTDTGYRPIGQLQVGDRVLTHTGKWKPVTAVMVRHGAPLTVVRGTGLVPITTTSEHPFYARTRTHAWDNTRRRNRFVYSAPEWVEAGALTHTQLVGQVLPPEQDRADISTELLWVIGRYLADGWRVARRGRSAGRVVLCANAKKLPELRSRIEAAGLHATVSCERTVTKLHITVGWLYTLLESFGHRAHGKTIPGWCLQLPPEKASALLDGWASGDGHTPSGRTHTNVVTTSKSLALGMVLLCQRARGALASVYITRATGPTTQIKGRTVRQRSCYYTVRLPTPGRHQGLVEGDYGWRRVRTVTPAGAATVYNISVADDESYVADGVVVHNCQDVSVAGKGAGLAGARSGLWREFARIIGEVEPGWVFIENSPMLRTRGLDVVLADLARLGYDAAWGVLGADAPAVAFGSEVPAVTHNRDRIWIVARSNTNRLRELEQTVPRQSKRLWAEYVGSGSTPLAHPEHQRTGMEGPEHPLGSAREVGQWHRSPAEAGLAWWTRDPSTPESLLEPRVGRMADGVANRKHRLAALGNGQVPAVAALAWQVLSARLEEHT